MCIAIPMELIEVSERRGRVRSAGVELEVGLELLDDVQPGDYVIVHAGYAIQSIPPDEARETLAIFERLAEQAEDG